MGSSIFTQDVKRMNTKSKLWESRCEDLRFLLPKQILLECFSLVENISLTNNKKKRCFQVASNYDCFFL